MKTAEEIINNLPDLGSGFDDFYGRQALIEAIEQAQKEAYNAGKEQLKREGIIIISEDGFVLKDETLDNYREKLKIIINAL